MLPVTLGFLIGVLGGARIPCPWPVVVGMGAVGAALAVMPWRGNRRWQTAALVLLWVCLGTLRMQVWQQHPEMRLAARLPGAPQPAQVHGVVIDDPLGPFDPAAPADDEGRAADSPEPTSQRAAAGRSAPRRLRRYPGSSSSCLLSLRHVRREGGWQRLAGRLRVSFDASRLPLVYGDEVLLEGQWERVPSPGNPGEYDRRAALARWRVHGLLRVKPMHGAVILRRNQQPRWLMAIARLRQRWQRLIQRAFLPSDANLLCSVLLGQRTLLDDRLQDAFVKTGTVHLLVISGFNVGLIAALLEMGLRLAGLPWRLRLLVVAAGIGGYAMVIGWQPPVARAALMAWVVLGAAALDRDVNWLNTLALAALIMLWLQPSQVFDPGFQLSYGAVLALLLFTPSWQPWLDAHLGWLRPSWLRRSITLSLSATSAVWLGLSPILAWYFHLLSPVSMLANLLIAPLMAALVWLGTALLILGSLCDPILLWGRGALTMLLHATVRCVWWCHAIPGGCVSVRHPGWGLLLGYYGLLALSCARMRLGLSRASLLICWMAGLTVWLWSLLGQSVGHSRWMRVDVLDVGHGDCLLVRTPAGHALLVDAGSRQAGQFHVLPMLRYEGITRLDALVLTHSDEDHLGGAIPLIEAIRVRRILTNGAWGETVPARALKRLAANRGIEVRPLRAGMAIDVGSQMTVDVLHPPRGFVPGTVAASNDNCVVLRLTRGLVSVLLTGDIEERGLPWLLRDAGVVRSTVLKVPHHGSRLGEVGERFFEAVHPQVAILSVGRLHHLPAPQTLEALRRTGCALYTTREDGAVSLRTDGLRLEVTTFKRAGQ